MANDTQDAIAAPSAATRQADLCEALGEYLRLEAARKRLLEKDPNLSRVVEYLRLADPDGTTWAIPAPLAISPTRSSPENI